MDFRKFHLRISGFLKITTSGWYTLGLASDDGSRLYIDNRPPPRGIDNSYRHGTREKSARLWLSAGFHPLQIRYFDDEQWQSLVLTIEGPPSLSNSGKAAVAAPLLWNANPCGEETKTIVEKRDDSPMCNNHGTCTPKCNNAYGACVGRECVCESPYTGATCETWPEPPEYGKVGGGTVVLLILLSLLLAGGLVAYWKRKPLGDWLLWKLSTTRYRNMGHAVTADGGGDDADDGRVDVGGEAGGMI